MNDRIGRLEKMLKHLSPTTTSTTVYYASGTKETMDIFDAIAACFEHRDAIAEIVPDDRNVAPLAIALLDAMMEIPSDAFMDIVGVEHDERRTCTGNTDRGAGPDAGAMGAD
ncbi:MAG: hypothetical protein ACOX7K_08125 [Oscillospiraceae bacterium]